MAQKVQVLLVCDLHDEEVEGVETVAFGLDGSNYEIDVCEEHGASLREDLASYVGAARRAGRAAAPAQRRTGRSGSTSSRPTSSGGRDLADVRRWARENGHEVSERGRISGSVLEAYDAAH